MPVAVRRKFGLKKRRHGQGELKRGRPEGGVVRVPGGTLQGEQAKGDHGH